uniref:Proteasome subunit alpha type n=1 Tax=Kalanchoe fedtschenkoi TaxID=63787 RepID=A0A7N0TAD0_KALFE
MGDSQYSFSLTTFSPSGKLVQIEHALTAVGSGQTSLGIKAANGVVIATEKKLPSILVDEASVQKIQILTPNIGVVYSGMGPDSRVLVRKSRKQAEQYHRLYKEPIPVTQLCIIRLLLIWIEMGDSQYSFSLTTFSPSGKLVQIEHALTAVGSGQTSLGIKAANGVVIATEKKLPSILVDEASVQKIQILTPNIGVVYSGMGPDSRVLVRKSRKQAEQYHRLYKVDPSGSYFSWKASAMGKNVSNAKTFLEKR